MNRQSNIPHSDRPKPIDEDKEKPNLDPIRDDPEPLTLPPRETPQKQKMQIGEGSYEGTQKYAEGISKYPETADVESLFLAGLAHDKLGLNNPVLQRRYLQAIIDRDQRGRIANVIRNILQPPATGIRPRRPIP